MHIGLLGHADWQERLDEICGLMREMSVQTDPQEMVRAYGRRMERIFPVDRRICLSRRDLSAPRFRVTRYSEWKEDINPWKQRHRLPLLEGGLFAELIYSDQPRIIDDIGLSPEEQLVNATTATAARLRKVSLFNIKSPLRTRTAAARSSSRIREAGRIRLVLWHIRPA